MSKDTMSKMRRSHEKAREYLESLGYLVWYVVHSRFSRDIIFKGAKDVGFDGVAMKEGEEPIFLQVSTNRFHIQLPYLMFAKKFQCRVMLVNVIDRKGLKAKLYEKNGDIHLYEQRNNKLRHRTKDKADKNKSCPLCETMGQDK